MYCVSCGGQLADPAPATCPACGVPIVGAAASSGAEKAVVRMLLPVDRSGWAIAAGYAGLFCLIIVPGPLALILGGVALWHLKRNPKLHGLGRAWFGLVAGLLATLVLGVIVVAGLTR